MRTSPRRGFTAIELMVVVVVIGILAAAGVAKYQNFTAVARKNACISNQSQIASALILAENDLGPLPGSSVVRFQYNGLIDPVNRYFVASDPVAYRVWGRAVPRSWGVTNGSPLNATVLQKAQETRVFVCPEDARVLSPQYQSISDLSGQAAASPADPVTYVYARTVTQPRGTTFSVPLAGAPPGTTDPLEGYNWLRQPVEWTYSSICFCRRWGLRDAQVSGATPAILNSSPSDTNYQPNRERYLAHTPHAPTSP